MKIVMRQLATSLNVAALAGDPASDHDQYRL